MSKLFFVGKLSRVLALPYPALVSDLKIQVIDILWRMEQFFVIRQCYLFYFNHISMSSGIHIIKTFWYFHKLVQKMKFDMANQYTGEQNHLFMFMKKESKNTLFYCLYLLTKPSENSFCPSHTCIHYLWKDINF